MKELEKVLYNIFQDYVDELEAVSFDLKKDINKTIKKNLKNKENINKLTDYLYKKILITFKKNNYFIKKIDTNLVCISTTEDF